MKILIALCAILAVCTARVVITAEGLTNVHLLGVQECTWGPSYWCENIKTASGCNATQHCIKTTWKDMTVPEDNDSVCTICKDMVQQARDQLESNQTQSDLEAVFEGSCKLIHIKPIVKECITIVDQFIPDLIETLASQMNPSVVCSVAGLCNSAHIDKLLEQYGSKLKVDQAKSHSLEKDELEPDECSKCYTVAAFMEHKLKKTSRDKVLEQMLNVCAEFGTFSDACSGIILTYFDTIYTHLQQNFNARSICHLSGQCSANFHKHEDADTTPKVEIRPLSSVGMVDVSDDLPCKLCEQLVGHLRDLLVANTTEIEFEKVLKELCKQTKSFATECIAIADEYYHQIYQFLTNGLNSNIVCQMSGICPAPGKVKQIEPIWAFAPGKTTEIGVGTEVTSNNDGISSTSEAQSMQLPLERLVPFPIFESFPGIKGEESCALCEYVLHYLQDSITNPTTEENVKQALGKVCKILPESIKGQCTEFVDVYGDAVIAILVQEIDPSRVCPMLHLCPTEKLMEMWQNVPSGYMYEELATNKPSCPLCLLAVTQIYDVIKNNKTEANIVTELDKLCIHLPHSLSEQCTDLVKGYSKELIELLLADLTPQEVCVYIKLCDAKKRIEPADEFVTDADGEILTNEIPTAPEIAKVLLNTQGNSNCVICEFVMHYVDKVLGNENERNKVEKAVRGVCNHLPKSISSECNNFVTKYASVIIDIITKDVSPKQVCTMMGLCSKYIAETKVAVTQCVVCESIMSVINTLLSDQNIANGITDGVSKVCKHVPASQQKPCDTLIHSYGQSIINLVINGVKSHKVCGKLGLCAHSDYSTGIETSRMKRSYEKSRIKHCTWGPVYWCSTNETARECKAVEHCKEHVWKADFAPPKQVTLSETEPNA